MNVKDKIAKLLALAESPVEAEAEEALLKAKEIMMKNKLSMADVDKPTVEVKRVLTDITCSKRRDPWIVDLGNVIAKNYCCKAFFVSEKGIQTKIIGFYGFDEDVSVCEKIFLYGLDCINKWVKDKRKRLSGTFTSFEIRSICDSYAEGFIHGIATAFQKQENDNQEWGLVSVIPKEVMERASKIKAVNFQGKSARVSDVYNSGFSAGVQFDPTTKIERSKTHEYR